jgi:hypothetical protein
MQKHHSHIYSKILKLQVNLCQINCSILLFVIILVSGQLVSLTPSLLQKGSLPPTPALSQKGIAVGAGEIPNGAGPFANAGMVHNTSDDSILTNQSGLIMNGSGRASSAHASRLLLQQQQQPSLETLGGSRYTEPYATNRLSTPLVSDPQPMGLPRANPAGPQKLVPGRMSQPVPQQQQSQPSRPQSRASGRAGSGRGVVPFTAV